MLLEQIGLGGRQLDNRTGTSSGWLAIGPSPSAAFILS